MTRPTREAYARAHATRNGVEVTVGLEIRDGDDEADLAHFVLALAQDGADTWRGRHMETVRRIEGMARGHHYSFHDRAYFIETEEAGKGVQVYQPYGMPRNQVPARTNDCPFESHADDCDCGGRAGDR